MIVYDTIPVNINRMVQVRLTDHGVKIARSYYEDLGLEAPQLSTDTPLRMPLWEIMQLFGSHLYAGAVDMPFVDNELFLDAE